MFESVEKLLKEHDQLQLLKCYKEIDGSDKEKLLNNISSLDFATVNDMFKKFKNSKEVADKLDELVRPVPEESYASTTTSSAAEIQSWVDEGLQEISGSKVGVILMAGGQGTRLGVPYPKGMYNVGMNSQKTLYHLFADKIQKLQNLALQKTGNNGFITWYIMTSEATMEQTQQYFKKCEYFGLESNNIKFFEQYTLPCMDFNGKVLLAANNKVAQSPDGNGGLYKAVLERGILKDMKSRGLEHIHTIGVDNILTKIADPAFVGLCKLNGVDCAAKVVKKSRPNEAVGVVCKVNEHFQVVEYSEISEVTSQKKDSCGNLVFNAGNICNHYFSVDFLQNACTHANELPLHIARKKIPHVNDDGVVVKPTTPNGIKMEKFVFDVFKLSKKFMVMDVPRCDEFSPLKNAMGASSATPLHSRNSLKYLHHRWLVNAGATVCMPDGKIFNPPKSIDEVEGEYPVDVEISPLISYGGEGLESLAKGKTLTSPVYLS